MVLAVCLALLAGSCGGGSGGDEATDGPIVVESDDGIATLTVPQTALPSGLDPGDLTVTRVPDSELGDDAAGAAVYLLGPDGTTLGEGATFTTTLESQSEHLPMVLQISSGDMEVDGSDEPLPFTVETVNGVHLSRDVDAGTWLVEAPVSHFSSIIITRSIAEFAFFKSRSTNAHAPVGQMPASQLKIEKTSTLRTSGDYPGQDSWTFYYSDQIIEPQWFYMDEVTHYKANDGLKGTISLRFTLVEGSATISGTYEPFQTENLEPNAKIIHRPPRTPLVDSYTIPNVDFTCTAEGSASILYRVVIGWDEVWELQRAWDPEWRELRTVSQSAFLDVLVGANCVPAPAATTTTTTQPSSDTTVGEQASTTGTVQLGDATYAVTVPTRVEQGTQLEFQVCVTETATGEPVTGINAFFTLGRNPGGSDASHASGTLGSDGCFTGSVEVKEGPGPTGAYTSDGSEAAQAAEVEIIPAGE